MTLICTTSSIAVSALLTVTLSACQSDRPDGPRPRDDLAAMVTCDYGTGEAERLGGPLQRHDRNTFTLGMTYVEPGSLRDAAVVRLDNRGDAPIVIDEVDLVPDPDASSLVLAGTFVARPGTAERVSKVRDDNRYQPAGGYCVPAIDRPEDAPILVLRIGPSRRAAGTHHRFSRNNSINVHYRTSNGQRYVAAIPIRFEYPNRPPA